MKNNDEIIRVNDLSIYYESNCILRNVNFNCKNGEFVSVVGKSGIGKSSFLNALAGFIPYEGTISIPAKFGYVFQNFALFPWLTVKQNIEFGLEHLTSNEKYIRTKEMLEKIEMVNQSKYYPFKLSGGQIQRAALARALAPDPQVLLMDEPYGALDHHTRDKMQSWLLSIWNDLKKTVLFVTHYIEEAIFLADRVIVINNKKFVADIQIPFSRPRNEDLRFSEHFLDVKLSILNYM